MTNVHIHHIVVRLPGGSVAQAKRTARAVAAELGRNAGQLTGGGTVMVDRHGTAVVPQRIARQAVQKLLVTDRGRLFKPPNQPLFKPEGGSNDPSLS